MRNVDFIAMLYYMQCTHVHNMTFLCVFITVLTTLTLRVFSVNNVMYFHAGLNLEYGQ